jgi:hypothetical protein
MMALYARNKASSFVPAPAALHYAICCDVVDMGMVHSEKFQKTQHKCQLRWQTESTMKDGKPYLIVKTYTLSLHPKARLRLDLESWRGRPFTDEEATEFDIEKLLDAMCQINVIHVKAADGSGAVFSNVASIVPAGKHAPILRVHDYERVSSREGYKAPAPDPLEGTDEPPPHTDADMGSEDDPIPF